MSAARFDIVERCLDLRQGATGRSRYAVRMQGDELLLFAAAVGGVVAAAAATLRWRRAVRIRQTGVLIGEAMKRRGITPADAEAAGLEPEAFAAQLRCATCVADPACRVWLSGVGTDDLPQQCPNRSFFEQVVQHKAIQDSRISRQIQ